MSLLSKMALNGGKKKKLAFLGMAISVLGGFSLLVYDFLAPNEVVPVKLVRVTIPEGFNVRQIAERLNEAGLFSAEDFIKLAQKEEGFLFPDTYEFYGHAGPEEIILKMKENFERKVGPEVSRDVIIMASLLEEEAKHDGDWEIISGILWKRLEAGMALQVDAEPGTYDYPGLPPGPISNPGLDAVDAALHPAASPYWYYLSDKAGNIHYARTFEEHKLNKEKYLR